MPRKIIRRTVPEANFLADDLHPVLRRLYAARHIRSMQELDYSLQRLLSYHRLKGIDAATDLFEQSLRRQERMLIVADFDADGATSCALAVRVLKKMGARHVDYIVPNRFEHGYGLTPAIVDVAMNLNPDLIITVDNGISSNAGVDHAHELDIKVLITDHHLPGSALPDADAIVNPQQHGDEFPSKCLAGVGVMFYVLSALRTRLREQDWFEKNNLPEPNLAHYLDLVALGSVADMVPLDRNNRILVSHGLMRIQSGQSNPGIRALLRVAGRNADCITAADLGFAVAPRLNAAGRLTDMSVGIETLLTEESETALALARHLDTLNCRRKKIQAEMQEQALTAIRRILSASPGKLPAGICRFHPDWHAGIVGLVAGKLKDRFHRPAIAFAREQGKLIKGSARSIMGVHIRDVLSCIAARNPELINNFGGHAMAAGLTIYEENLEPFQSAFQNVVSEFCGNADVCSELLTDGELPEDMLTLEFAALLQESGPWGQSFPAPCFDDQFDVINKRLLDGNHLKFTLKKNAAAPIVDAIAFNINDNICNEQFTRIHAVYSLDINNFRERKSLQLIIEEFAPCR